MVFLPNKLHGGLRRLAFDHRTSAAELILPDVPLCYTSPEAIADKEAP